MIIDGATGFILSYMRLNSKNRYSNALNLIANPPKWHPPTGESVSRSLGGGGRVKLIKGFDDFTIPIFI